MRASLSRPLIAASVLVTLGLLVPQAASARGNVAVPPGNSAISQYLESIPTATGGKPTNSIQQPTQGSHHAATYPGGGPSGGSGGGGGLPASTNRALSRQGSVGKADAAFSAATAAAPSGRSNRATASGASVSPANAVLKSLVGSSSNGGLGPLLPVILAVALVAGGSLALLRRRRRAGS